MVAVGASRGWGVGYLVGYEVVVLDVLLILLVPEHTQTISRVALFFLKYRFPHENLGPFRL